MHAVICKMIPYDLLGWSVYLPLAAQFIMRGKVTLDLLLSMFKHLFSHLFVLDHSH